VNAVSTTEGEFVTLEDSPDFPGRNVLKYDGRGTLLWRIGPRDFRPTDQLTGIEFDTAESVTVLAADNGWTARVDLTTGAFLEVIATNQK
jgi:hypothetical protein